MNTLAMVALSFLLSIPGLWSASWYGDHFHGRPTASGTTYNMYEFTAASPHLPFGTVLRVERAGQVVFVEITDRGPFCTQALGEGQLVAHPTRDLDLSRAAFAQIASLSEGVIRDLRVEVVPARPILPTEEEEAGSNVPEPWPPEWRNFYAF